MHDMKQSIAQRLNAQPEALTHLLFNLSEEQIRSRPLPEKWSIYENLVHLARYHEIFLQRIEAIQTMATPVFPAYKAEDDPGFYTWQQKTYAQLMQDFNTDRTQLNALLNSFNETQLSFTGKHSVYGLTMNIEGWTEFFLLHEAHHFLTILKLSALVNKERIFGLA